MPTTKTNFTKRWLTVLDVVEEYGFSDTKQYQLRKDKKIPFSKIQGSIYNAPHKPNHLNQLFYSK